MRIDGVDHGRIAAVATAPAAAAAAVGTAAGSMMQGMQFAPVQHQFSAAPGMLLFPVTEQVEAGVIDVVELLDIDVQLESWRDLLQHAGQVRQADKGGGAGERDPSAPLARFDVQAGI